MTGNSRPFSSFEEIVAAIQVAASDDPQSTISIGIDGAGGSGKSTLAARLAEAIAASTVVHIDDFADWKEGPGWNIDRFTAQVMHPLANGLTATYQRYDWRSDSLAEWHEIPTDGVVIVEGVAPLRPELRDYWHVSVWVDCPRDLRLKRGVERDGEAMRSQWEDVWMPEEDIYVQRDRPWEHAQFVYDGSGASGGTEFEPPCG